MVKRWQNRVGHTRTSGRVIPLRMTNDEHGPHNDIGKQVESLRVHDFIALSRSPSLLHFVRTKAWDRNSACIDRLHAWMWTGQPESILPKIRPGHNAESCRGTLQGRPFFQATSCAAERYRPLREPNTVDTKGRVFADKKRLQNHSPRDVFQSPPMHDHHDGDKRQDNRRHMKRLVMVPAVFVLSMGRVTSHQSMTAPVSGR